MTVLFNEKDLTIELLLAIQSTLLEELFRQLIKLEKSLFLQCFYQQNTVLHISINMK